MTARYLPADVDLGGDPEPLTRPARALRPAPLPEDRKPRRPGIPIKPVAPVDDYDKVLNRLGDDLYPGAASYPRRPDAAARPGRPIPIHTPDPDDPITFHRGGGSVAHGLFQQVHSGQVWIPFRPAPPTADDVAAAAAGIRYMMTRYANAFATVGAAVTAMHDQFKQAGVLPDTPPDDPKAAALWHVRHRHNGPPRPAAGKSRRPRSHR